MSTQQASLGWWGNTATAVAQALNLGRSLQFKATVLVVTLTLGVTAAVASYLLRAGFEVSRAQQRNELSQIAMVLAGAAAEPLQAENQDALHALVQKAANGQPLEYVIVTDAGGKELASAHDGDQALIEQARAHGSTPQLVLGVPTVFENEGGTIPFWDIVYPIRASDQFAADAPLPTRLLGYVRVGLVGEHWHRTMASKLDMLIGVGTVATAAAILMGFLVIRRIFRPLEGLGDAMVRFSRGELNVRSPVTRHDEIGRLAEIFNRMADQQQRDRNRVLRLNAELEERVIERTRQLRELAAMDPLSGLYNRRHLNEVLERGFSEAQRYGHDLACIMMDLDDFKAVNDNHGHHVGDKLLVMAAQTIKSQLRGSDVAARFGGDEFTVLLPQTDADSARALAARIVECFRRSLQEEMPRLKTTLSAGIASVRSVEAPDADSLLLSADRALYEAKGAGKNQVVTATFAARPTPL